MRKSKRRNGKGPGRFPAFALALCLALGGSLAGAPVKVSAEEYTYQVTFYSGNQGSFQGTEGLSVDNHSSGSAYTVEESGDAVTVSGLKRGDIVSITCAACVRAAVTTIRWRLRRSAWTGMRSMWWHTGSAAARLAIR